jgi:hypothetical protein
MRSDALAGLKPGFFIVVGGFCEKPDAAKVVAALRAVEKGTYAKPTTSGEPLACPVETLRRLLASGATEHPARPRAAPSLVAVKSASSVEVLLIDEAGRILSGWVDPTKAPEPPTESDSASISGRTIRVLDDGYEIDVTTRLSRLSLMCEYSETTTYRVGLKAGRVQQLRRRVGPQEQVCGE